MISNKFHIETTVSKDELSKHLKRYEPWRIGVSFSNGVSTEDFETMGPFTDIPLNKLLIISKHCSEEWLHNRRVLDVGSNIGYNSITLAQQFGCQVTGLEYNPKNIEKSELLARLSGIHINFLTADAVTYFEENEYELILHLGTLYHLSDPVLALKNTALSLKKEGKLYIESAIYHNEDEHACRFIYGMGGDKTNYWALSPFVVKEILAECGLKNIQQIHDFEIQSYEGTGMSRGIFYAEQ